MNGKIKIKEWFSPVFFKNPFLSKFLTRLEEGLNLIRDKIKQREDFFKPLL